MRVKPRHGASLLAAATLLLAIAAAQATELRPYPRAQGHGRAPSNRLEAGALPISPPERAKGKNESRWRLPYEGQVSMQQYKHPADDSPLLIARHYAGQLQGAGLRARHHLRHPLRRACRTPMRRCTGSTSWTWPSGFSTTTSATGACT